MAIDRCLMQEVQIRITQCRVWFLHRIPLFHELFQAVSLLLESRVVKSLVGEYFLEPLLSPDQLVSNVLLPGRGRSRRNIVEERLVVAIDIHA